SLVLHLGHPQVRCLLEHAQRLLADVGRFVNVPPTLSHTKLDTRFDDDPEGLQDLVERFLCQSEKAWQPFRGDKEFLPRLALLKALLMSADAAGSALPANGKSLGQWIPEALSVRVRAADLEPVV